MAARTKRTSAFAITREQRVHLDALCREVVMRRARAVQVRERVSKDKEVVRWWGRCEWCRHPRWLQWAHIKGRGEAPGLVHEPSNAWAACSGCHIFRWHKDPHEAVEFIKRLRGAHVYAQLVVLKRMRGLKRRTYKEQVAALQQLRLRAVVEGR